MEATIEDNATAGQQMALLGRFHLVLCSLVWVDLILDLSGLEWFVSGRWRSTNMQLECWRGTGQTCEDGAMFEHGHSQTQNPSTSSAVAFHVRTSATLESVPELLASDLDYGQSSQESFANYDRKSSLWRTLQRCLLGGLIEFSGTWPTSGTMRNGKCFRRVPLEFHNRDIEFSLWPTVTSVAPAKNGYNRAGQSCGLVAIRKRAISEGGSPGPLNPQFLEWLAGFPTDWTALPNSETL